LPLSGQSGSRLKNPSEMSLTMKKPVNATIKVSVFCVLCALPASAQIPNHRLFYQQDSRAPLTKLEIVFLGAGSIRDETSRTGLALTVARLMDVYFRKLGYTARLETLGTDLDFNTYYEYQIISIETLSTNLTASLRIVSDFLRRMAVTDPALEEAKRKLQRSYERTADAGNRGLLRNYALSRTAGVERWFSQEALKQITVEEVRQNCARFLNAEVVFFKAITDLDSTEVEAMLRPITNDRQKGGFVWSSATREKDRLPGHTAFVFEHYSHLKNVDCHWLIPIGSVGEDNFVPNMVSWTLGRGTGRGLLYGYFRQELGLVYGNTCSFRREDDVRLLDIYADPRLENSEKLISKTYEFIAGLADNPEFWAAIGELRENPDVIDAHTHGERTPQRRLNREVDQALYNFPSREDGIRSVTDGEIRSFLQEYFVKENMVMMLFGPKDHIIEILEKHWPDMTIHVQPVEKAIE